VDTSHLIALLDKAYTRFRTRLEGLTDTELTWAPAPVVWNVHPDGEPVPWDFALMPTPTQPAPVTTIGWRLVHIIDLLTEDRCWAELGLDVPAPQVVKIPTTADAAIAELDAAFSTWRGILEAADSSRLGESVEGQRWPDRATFALHIIDELIHHAAEVSLLRDLHAAHHAEDDPTRPTLIADLASQGRWLETLAAIEAGTADVNAPGAQASALHHAAGIGKLDVVRALVTAGARTDAIDTVFRVTPLQWAETMSKRMGGPNAAGARYTEVIEYLRSAG
jgi:hypothetical protein